LSSDNSGRESLASTACWIAAIRAHESEHMLTSPWTRSLIESLEKSGVPWVSAMDEPEVVLAERGWSATVAQLGEEGADFGRWSYPIVPRSVPGIPRSFLVTATRRATAGAIT